MTHHILLFESFTGTPTAIMKNKLGIKNDAVSDEDFMKLVDTGIERSLLPAFVSALNTNNLDTVVYYARQVKEHAIKLSPTNYANFVDFTEAVDAAVTTKNVRKEIESFSPETTPPDHTAANGRYRVYAAKGRNDCVKYGKGQTFCISRIGQGNLYSSYRSAQASKFYFVYDMKMMGKNAFVTVVDANAKGFEFTQVDNDTTATTAKFKGSLQKFLSTKPGLSELAYVFVPAPLSNDEHEEIEKWKGVNKHKTFSQLSYSEKSKFIQQGTYGLPAADFEKLDKDMKYEYVNFGLPIERSSLPTLPPNLTRLYIQRLQDAGGRLNSESFAMLSPEAQKFALTLAVTYGINFHSLKTTQYDAYWLGVISTRDPAPNSKTLTAPYAEFVTHFAPATNMAWLEKLAQFNVGVSFDQFTALDKIARDYALKHGVVYKATDMEFIRASDADKRFLLDHQLVDKFFNQNIEKLTPAWQTEIINKELYFLSSFAFEEMPDRLKEIALVQGTIGKITIASFKNLNDAWRERMFTAKRVAHVRADQAHVIPSEWVQRFKEAELVSLMSCTNIDFLMLRDEQRQFLASNGLVTKARENSMEFQRLREPSQKVLYDLDLVD